MDEFRKLWFIENSRKVGYVLLKFNEYHTDDTQVKDGKLILSDNIMNTLDANRITKIKLHYHDELYITNLKKTIENIGELPIEFMEGFKPRKESIIEEVFNEFDANKARRASDQHQQTTLGH